MNKSNERKTEENQNIYLSIDHLKSGEYILNITLSNKIIKTVKLKK